MTDTTKTPAAPATPAKPAKPKAQVFDVIAKTWQNNRLYEGDGTETVTLAIDWNETDYPALRPVSQRDEPPAEGDLA